jgi:hypothetical protein
VTPAGIPLGDADNVIGQGVAVDPCNPAVVYWGNTPFGHDYAGLYRTTDFGASWTRFGSPTSDPNGYDTTTNFLEDPLHVRIDPNDTQHLYGGAGVRGANVGFWISHDGGFNWTKPDNWVSTGKQNGIFIDDVYDVAVDPSDFNHVLVSSHAAWSWPDSGPNPPGVLESTDGGTTWIVHQPQPTWDWGHTIHFLHSPELGVGDANTWLLGTQGDGMWRTEDAGATWTKVTDSCIEHGGGTIYYAKTGSLYASSVDGLLRSNDNGKTWETIKLGFKTIGIIGDGHSLYTGQSYAQGDYPILISDETDGLTWKPYGDGHVFQGNGPYNFAIDRSNGILYASMWSLGIWATKIDVP